MNLEEAIRLLDVGTDPRNVGKHTRQDYAAYQAAMDLLRALKVVPAEAAKDTEVKNG